VKLLFLKARKHKATGRRYWRKVTRPQRRLFYGESVVEGDRISPLQRHGQTAAETGNLFLQCLEW